MFLGGSGQSLHYSGKVIITGGKAEIYCCTARGTLADHIHDNPGFGKNIKMFSQALCAVLRTGKGGEQDILFAANLADAIHNKTPFLFESV